MTSAEHARIREKRKRARDLPAWQRMEAARSRYKAQFILDSRPEGRGSYAEVYAATARTTGERFALKRLFCLDSESVTRLRREILVSETLHHPNVMPIEQADFEPAWYVMPLAGSSLERQLRTLSLQDLGDVLYSVTDALATAHAAGFLHRDISPANVLLLESPQRWVLADWGMVRVPASLRSRSITRTGRGMGTYGYVAPEVWQDGRSATPASDVFSIGRVALAVLLREPPHSASDPIKAPPEWLDLVAAATRRDPSDRLSLKELRERLETCMTGGWFPSR
jgi:serine/threonine protein kinase